MTSERVQKVLARAGLGSRRGCEELIREGRVTVNGRIASLGSSADPTLDEIRVDGERLSTGGELVYVALNKPVGVVSSSRAQGARQTVLELVDVPQRLFAVGRLDVDSEGLVLLTNDGEAALRLTHPRYEQEKEYRVLVDRLPATENVEAWRRGIVLGDGSRAMPAKVSLVSREGKGAWLSVVMQEGRKRQIRETAQLLGLHVRRLVRVRIDGIRLGDLKPGEWRRLSPPEAERLRRDLAKPGGAGRTRRGVGPALRDRTTPASGRGRSRGKGGR